MSNVPRDWREQLASLPLVAHYKPTTTRAPLWLVELARDEHGSTGSVEFDAGTTVSYSDDHENGTYVQAWVWVQIGEGD